MRSGFVVENQDNQREESVELKSRFDEGNQDNQREESDELRSGFVEGNQDNQRKGIDELRSGFVVGWGGGRENTRSGKEGSKREERGPWLKKGLRIREIEREERGGMLRCFDTGGERM